MNPSCGPELVPVEVGRGGEEEVKVVARRVGLKRRDEGFDGDIKHSEWPSKKSATIPFVAK